jgi:hypothetical protein
VPTPSVSEPLKAIRVVKWTTSTKPEQGTAKLRHKLWPLNQYWASHRRQIKITDYSILT